MKEVLLVDVGRTSISQLCILVSVVEPWSVEPKGWPSMSSP